MNTCKTCRHPKVDQVNTLLTSGIPLRSIANQYDNLSIGTLKRHKDACIEALFDEIRAQKREGLLDAVDEVRQEIVDVKAIFIDNPNVRIGLIGKMLDVITQEAKLTGAYIKEQINPTDEATLARVLTQRLTEKGFSPDEARQIAQSEYKIQDLGEAG